MNVTEAGIKQGAHGGRVNRSTHVTGRKGRTKRAIKLFNYCYPRNQKNKDNGKWERWYKGKRCLSPNKKL